MKIDGVELLHGDCRELIKAMPDNSVDSIVTDPPYGLEFMGKDWDAPWKAGAVLDDPASVGGFQDGAGGNPFSRSRIRYGREGDAIYGFQEWCQEWAAECLRVLKPGGYLLAFSSSRTYHRLACAVEDAGFEIRDQIMWVYGSGFPKSLNVSKSIEAKLTNGSAQKNGFHKLTGERTGDGKVGMYASVAEHGFRSHNPEQLGAFNLEPITPEAQQWAGWGTALKPAHEPIVMARKPFVGSVAANVLAWGTGAINIDASRVPDGERFPANFIHDGSDEVLEIAGEAARFFYCAKPGKKERNAGLGHLDEVAAPKMDGGAFTSPTGNDSTKVTAQNFHPTVKPLALMRYLIRMVTPPGGTVLEPFAGSGTTLMAAIMEGYNAIGCELTADYLPIIQGRIQWAYEQTEPRLF